jgi:hypothetical protein
MPRIGGGDIGRARRRVGEPSGERGVKFRAATGEAQGLSNIAGALRDVAEVTGRMEDERTKLTNTMAVDKAMNEYHLRRTTIAREIEAAKGEKAIGNTKFYNEWHHSMLPVIMENHGLSPEQQALFHNRVSPQYHRDIDNVSIKESEETFNGVTESVMQSINDRADVAYSDPDSASDLVRDVVEGILPDYYSNPVVGLHVTDDMRSDQYRAAVQNIYTAAVLGKLDADPEAVAEEIKDGKVTFSRRNSVTGEIETETVKLTNVMDAESFENIKAQARVKKKEAREDAIIAQRDYDNEQTLYYLDKMDKGTANLNEIENDTKMSSDQRIAVKKAFFADKYDTDDDDLAVEWLRKVEERPEEIESPSEILDFVGKKKKEGRLSRNTALRYIDTWQKSVDMMPDGTVRKKAGHDKNKYGNYKDVYSQLRRNLKRLATKNVITPQQERYYLESLEVWRQNSEDKNPIPWADEVFQQTPAWYQKMLTGVFPFASKFIPPTDPTHEESVAKARAITERLLGEEGAATQGVASDRERGISNLMQAWGWTRERAEKEYDRVMGK